MTRTAADAVVLVSTARTPVGKFGGSLSGVDSVDLGAAAVRAAVQRAGGLTPDRVLLGNVVQAGNGQNPARIAATRAGVPTTVPAVTLNDVCLASMSAVGFAAALIDTGQLETAVVGGFDSMSRALHGVQVRAAGRTGDGRLVDLLVRDGLWCGITDQGMGPMSDAKNRELGVTRADQDELSAASHRRADEATRSGRMADEIVALDDIELIADEGIRPSTTLEALARLRPAFVAGGSITAGNSSQMSDAGAAGVLTTAENARRHGLEPIVEVVGAAVAAGPDATLHLKPAVAAQRVLERHGVTVGDIGLWEINEAFAGVVLASMRELGLDASAVNVNGGAIALGHPLAATGFRLVSTLALHMRRTGTELGVATMCGGGGQGEAVLLRLAA